MYEETISSLFPIEVSKDPLIFTLFLPNYNHASGGNRCLYMLGEYLIRLGHTVYGYNYNRAPVKIVNWSSVKWVKYPVSKSIFILPEVVDLRQVLPGFKEEVKIVRWALNNPGCIRGPKKYGSNEIVFYFSEPFKEASIDASYDGKAYKLCLGTVDLSEFRDYGKRDLNLWYEGKGKSDNSHPEECLRLTREWPPTRAELFKLYARTESLYSYDNVTGVLLEAYLAGCKAYERINGEWVVAHLPEDIDSHIIRPSRDLNVIRDMVEIVRKEM